MNVDPYLIAGLSLCLILGLCLAIMFTMRDRQSAVPHVVSRSAWCERYRRNATVDFIEGTSTGLTLRTVRHCSLRVVGERCGEACRYSSVPTLGPANALPGTSRLPVYS